MPVVSSFFKGWGLSRFNPTSCDILYPLHPVADKWAGGGSGLFPGVSNVAVRADVTVNATCGERGPEVYCRRSLRGGSGCGVCDSRSPDPSKRHPPRNIVDGSPDTWWQSPSLAAGAEYEWVTVTMDLKQVRGFISC